MSSQIDSNPVLDFALNHPYGEWELEKGVGKVVSFGDASHKCPTYVKRVPPCSAGCPAEEDIRGYHNILRGTEKVDGNVWEEAFYRIAEKNPFPSVMGRVCPAPCESKCNRQYVDETIGINAVEHAIGTYAIENNLKLLEAGTDTGKNIAVVGSGPAGLSCAYQLRRKGHKVTLFESFERLGGMMRYGIMGYRVPREILDKEIQRIIDLGVEVKTNCRIGKDISLEQLRNDYDAVYMGIGAQKGRNLPIPGADSSEGVKTAIGFLQEFEAKEISGETMQIGNRVLVIGDGDVAMDCARLALRLGAKDVKLISGVAREDMNCSEPEFAEAEQEGTKFEYCLGSKEVTSNDSGVILKTVNTQKKEKGEDGWNSPIPFLRYKSVDGSDSEIEADLIITSIGQTLDLDGIEDIKKDDAPWLKVNKYYQIPNMPDVFSGGDALKLTLLTTAIGHGRKAADYIDYFVNGKEMPLIERQDVIQFDGMNSYFFEQSTQVKREHRHISNVEGDFTEILQVLDQQKAVSESERCMSCGLCFECNQCLLYCPQEAIEKFKKNPIGEVMFTDYSKCVGCHICAEVCPCGYIHMAMGEDL